MRNKANITIEQIFDNILENRTTVCYNEKTRANMAKTVGRLHQERNQREGAVWY